MSDLMQKIKQEGSTNLSTYILMDDKKVEGFLNIKDLVNLGKDLIGHGNTDYINSEIDNNKMSVILFRQESYKPTHKEQFYTTFSLIKETK